jgi:hypothetical protein
MSKRVYLKGPADSLAAVHDEAGVQVTEFVDGWPTRQISIFGKEWITSLDDHHPLSGHDARRPATARGLAAKTVVPCERCDGTGWVCEADDAQCWESGATSRPWSRERSREVTRWLNRAATLTEALARYLGQKTSRPLFSPTAQLLAEPDGDRPNDTQHS